jgi:hypothetical protein
MVIKLTVVIMEGYLCYQLHTVLSNIFILRLTLYVCKITGDHHHGYQCNRSTTDQIFCICQVQNKKWEYNVTVHQLFIDFEKAYDSVKREVLYKILFELGITMKLD